MSEHTGARRCSHPNGAYRHFFGPARWACNARCRYGKIRIHRFHRTLRHLYHGLFAHHSLRMKCIGLYTQQKHLHFLCIGHDTAPYTGRTTWHSGQYSGYAPSRTAFGSSHAPSLVRKGHFDGLGDFIQLFFHVFCPFYPMETREYAGLSIEQKSLSINL